jgi:hypothetical protein
LIRGQQEGDIAANQNVHVLAEYFATLLFGLTIQVRDGVREEQARLVIDLAMQVLPK